MHPAVAALPFEDQGLVLAALLARTPPATLATRIGGAAGARCAATLEALALEPKPARAAALAELITIFRAPVPAGVERVHPEWLRDRLSRETTPMLLALTAGLPAEVQRVAQEIIAERGEAGQPMADLPEPIRRELQRIVFGGLVPLAGPGAPEGSKVSGQVAALLALDPAALVETVERHGAAALATELRDEDPSALQALAQRLPIDLGRRLLEAA